MGKLLDKLKADQIMRNFCFLLADKERLAFLREIATGTANCWMRPKA